MKKNQVIAATCFSAIALLVGCSTSGTSPMMSQYPSSSPSAANTSAYGVVDSIQVMQSSSGASTAGTVAGGVVGGLLGNQVGSGRGQTAATVAGAVGGAMLGNEMAKNASGGGQAYQIRVRLDNGSYQTIQQDSITDLQVGSRVRIENGRVYRY
ncbi:MAG TPA: glycine zipper 2TM domain-containing protein [Burkholderiaceae bacterium]|nr:glycine zipper 2TM domain-containing protein [Burkholderiaceae bacterium]